MNKRIKFGKKFIAQRKYDHFCQKSQNDQKIIVLEPISNLRFDKLFQNIQLDK